ncbi:MAG: CoA pyrophosphatase [Chloroflexota bacterium]|nr:CoA pyrophosphatase [Chloroflexota bacterium]
MRDITEVVSRLRARLETPERAPVLAEILAKKQRLPPRHAAVLVALFERDAQAHMLFIRRASTLRSHSGEIAFPGGSIDAIDASPVMAALREAQEEVGLHPPLVEVLGVLPPVFTQVSNFLITPVVACLPQGLGTLQAQASEVAEIILASLHGLADPLIVHTEEWMRDGEPHTIYFYDYGSYRIWGATARILNALLELLVP